MKDLIERLEVLHEGLDSRIRKRLDLLLKDPKYADTVVFVQGNGPGSTEFGYTQSRKIKRWKRSPMFGSVEIHRDPQFGPCYDGWQVVGAEADSGWGPLLYEVALEWASKNGGGLFSDRETVSGEALAVWSKYFMRRVGLKQMDIKRQSIFEPDYPQLTPDYPDDDCIQISATDLLGQHWYRSPLSKIYFKKTPVVMNALKKAGKLEIR